MTWKHVRGPRVKATCKCGGVAVVVSVPIVESSGVMIAASDGSHVSGVSNEAMVISTDYYEYETLVPGAVWLVDKATGTALARGVKVAMASATEVDDGTSTNPAIGMIVDLDRASGDTTAYIQILGEAATID